MSAPRGDGGRGAGGSRAAGGTPQAVSLLDSAGSPHPRAHAWLCAPAHVSARVPACRHTCPPAPSHVSPRTHACPRRGEARHVQAGARRAPEPHQRGGDAAADPGQRCGAGGRQPQQHQGEGPGLGGSWPQGPGGVPKALVRAPGCPQGAGPGVSLVCSALSWGVPTGLVPVPGGPGGYQQGRSLPWGIPGGFVPIPSGSGVPQVLILGQPRPQQRVCPPGDILHPLSAAYNPSMTPCKRSGTPLCPWRHPHPPSATCIPPVTSCILPGMLSSPR